MLGISRDTIIMNSLKYGGHTELIPRRRITIGMAEIFMAREIDSHAFTDVVLTLTDYRLSRFTGNFLSSPP